MGDQFLKRLCRLVTHRAATVTVQYDLSFPNFGTIGWPLDKPLDAWFEFIVPGPPSRTNPPETTTDLGHEA